MAAPADRSATLADLIQYVKDGSEDRIRTAFINQPNIKKEKKFFTVVKAAAEAANENILALILNNGFNVNAALDIAINNGNESIIDLVLDRGGDAEEGLYYAVKANNTNTIALLLKRGANVNTDRKNGNTPLHTAVIQKCDCSLVEFLIKNGADSSVLNKNNKTVLELVHNFLAGKIDQSTKQNMEKIEMLLKQNAKLSDSEFECLTGLPDGLSGYSYQIKLLTLYAVTYTKLAISKDCQYELGTEVKDLLPFDDIYLKKIGDGRTICHFVQVKQTKKPEYNKIKSSNFYTMLKSSKDIKEYIKGNDTIVKMFKKFKEIICALGNDVFGEFIYCNNTDFENNFDTGFIKVKTGQNENLLCGVGGQRWQIKDWRYLHREIKFVLFNLIRVSQYIKVMDQEFKEKFHIQIEAFDFFGTDDNASNYSDEDALWSIHTIANEGLKAIGAYLKLLDSFKLKIKNSRDEKDLKNCFPDDIELPHHTGDHLSFINNSIIKINEVIKSIDSDKELFVHFNELNDDLIKEYAEHFVKHFHIFTSCPTGDELDEIIREEISKEFKFKNSKYFSDHCIQHFSKWVSNFKNKRGHLFSDKDGVKLFHNLREQIFKDFSKPYVEQLHSYNINFENNGKEIIDFLNNKQNNKILHVVTKYTRLQAIKIFKTLQSHTTNFNYSNSVLITSSELVFRSNDTVDYFISAFSSKVSNDVLVIESSDDVKCELVYKVLFKLGNIITENVRKRVIVIAKNDSTLATALKSTFKEYGPYEDPVAFKDLTRESQNIILEQTIHFQNNPNLTSLILKIKDFLNVSLANVIIDEEILSIIITNTDSIQIGDSGAFHSDNYIDEFYIPRHVHHQLVDNGVLKYIENNLFFVTGISKDQLVPKVQGRVDLIHMREEDRTLDAGIILMSETEGNDDTNEETFARISNKYGNTIHWLEFRDDFIFWKGIKSKRLDADRIYIKILDMNQKLLDKYSIPPENLHQKVVILANNPGEGKSTMLTDLARAMREKSSNLWIIRVDLKDHVDINTPTSLKYINFNYEDTSKAVEAIIHIAVSARSDRTTALERKLLEAALNGCSEIGVLLLFDGFDEISPVYKEKACTLLKALTLSNVRQIWVTARVHMKAYLEEQLQVPACMLTTFTKDEQMRYLNKFWKWQLINYNIDETNIDENAISGIKDQIKLCYDNCFKYSANYDIYKNFNLRGLRELIDDKIDLLEFSKELLEKWKSSLHDGEDFLKVPQNLEILGENIFKSGWKVENLENLRLSDMYREFVENKFKIYEQDKSTTRRGNQADQDAADVAGVCYREMHREVAVKTLFQPKRYLPDLNICVKYNNIYEKLSRIGLLKSYGSRMEFVHRSYAEYFFSEYLVTHLKDTNVQSEFLGNILFDMEYDLVRKFFDGFLSRNQFILNMNEREESVVHAIEEIAMQKNNNGEHVLHIAAQNGQAQIILFISNNVTDSAFINLIMKHSSQGYTALHLAARNGCTEVCNVIMEITNKNALLFEELTMKGDQYRQTALHLAAENGHDSICDVIIKFAKKFSAIFKNLIMNCDENKQTALHRAAWKGNYEVCDVILNNIKQYPAVLKDIITACDKHQRTVLHLAAWNGHSITCDVIFGSIKEFPDLLIYLLIGCVYNKQTALHLAACNGHSKVLEVIMNTAKDNLNDLTFVNGIDVNNRTALHLAATFGHTDASNIILKVATGYPDIFKDVIMKSDEDNRTALHLAAGNGHSTICDVIMTTCKQYTDIFNDLLIKCDKHKQNALCLAALHGFASTCKVIIRNAREYEVLKDMLMNCGEEKPTPLHAAAVCGHREVFNIVMNTAKEYPILFKDLLVKYDHEKQTVLHIAARYGHIEICNVIMTNAKNHPDVFKNLLIKHEKRKQNALQIATWKGHSKVYDLIMKATREFPHILKDLVLNFDETNMSLLHAAAYSGHSEVRDAIITTTKEYPDIFNDYTVNFDIYEQSKLYESALNGHGEVFDLIVNAFKGLNNVYIKKTLNENSEVFRSEYLTVNEYYESGQTLLHIAACIGFSQLCCIIIERFKEYPDKFEELITKYDNNKRTALHLAAENGHSDICEVIMKASNEYSKVLKKLITRNNKFDQNALHVAAMNGRDKVCEVILKMCFPDVLKILIMQGDLKTRTPLHLAAENGHRKVCEIILKISKEYSELFHDFLIKYDDNEQTALHRAAKEGHADVFDVIIKFVMDSPDIFENLLPKCDKNKMNVLHIAAYENNSKICDLTMNATKSYPDVFENLVTKCAEYEQTALHLAAKKGHSEVCDVIIKHCKTYSNIFIYYNILSRCDEYGLDVLHLAAMYRNRDVCEVIMNHVKEYPDLFNDLITKCLENNQTALHVAAKNGDEGVCNVIIETSKEYPDAFKNVILKCDDNENTALHLAAANGYSEICEVLLKSALKYTDVFKNLINKYNLKKQTAFHLAAYYGHSEVCSVIIKTVKHLANVCDDDDILKDVMMKCDQNKQNALVLATGQGHSKVCDIILQTVKDTNVFQDLLTKSIEGRTSPLHIASYCGHSTICDVIIKTAKQHGDVFKSLLTKCDDNNKTALHIAAENGNRYICEVIIENVKDNPEVFRDLLTKCDVKNRTALHLGAENGYVEVCDVLMKSTEGYEQVFEYLITKLDDDGLTALHLAAVNDHSGICELIMKIDKERTK